MNFQNEKIGMMDEAYFVSRGDILKWLNELLQLNLTKIEQLGSAAVYCQVIDVVHPGKIAINKVNWKAQNDYEFMGNYRILQDAFKKIGIKRYLEVQKLAKARYQDNLEFSQWLKRYYDLNCGDRGNNYLAEERRGGNNPNFGFAEKNVVPKTYNASGAIIPKTNSTPPKNKEPVAETVPKKPVAPRVSNTDTSSRPSKKVEKKEVVEMSSPSTRVKSTDRPKKLKSVDKVRVKEEGGQGSQLQEELEQCREQLLRKREEQEEEAERQQVEIEYYKAEISLLRERSEERQEELKKQMKDMEDKLLMISQILNSEEVAELKIQMASEVVKLTTKSEQPQEDEVL